MRSRRAVLFSLLAAATLASGCTTDSASREPAYSGPTKTIRGYLRGSSYAWLTASSVVYITAYDATGGNSSHMPKIGGTSFTLNRNGYFPVAYEIEIPASGSAPRVALSVEIRRGGTILFSNDRNFSQTTGRNLDIPMREAPPRIRNFRGRL
ncbi:hypothetical protein FHS21_001073 [Phyllobacterium trifolii]|jgi:hypothetical protein|uniref:Lipoprotein n=1 Tax=Phyllobacterium trifolii TaxID=300193 RepID=A0A839U6R8_9HYPH|nr:hypothetical protein [Phyllobacterium trifolii]MBB3144672.1 hypothetical protein [Phyllobacterium trifolii]